MLDESQLEAIFSDLHKHHYMISVFSGFLSKEFAFSLDEDSITDLILTIQEEPKFVFVIQERTYYDGKDSKYWARAEISFAEGSYKSMWIDPLSDKTLVKILNRFKD